MSDITVRLRKAFLSVTLFDFKWPFICVAFLSKHVCFFFFRSENTLFFFLCPSPDKQVKDFLLWIRPKRLACAACWCNSLKQILWTFPLAFFSPSSIFSLFIIIIINFAFSGTAPWRFGVINMLVTFHSNEFECNDTWISVGVTVPPPLPFLYLITSRTWFMCKSWSLKNALLLFGNSDADPSLCVYMGLWMWRKKRSNYTAG